MTYGQTPYDEMDNQEVGVHVCGCDTLDCCVQMPIADFLCPVFLPTSVARLLDSRDLLIYHLVNKRVYIRSSSACN